MDHLSRPSCLFESIRKPPYDYDLEKRNSKRTACLIPVAFTVKGQTYRDSIENLSQGGAFIHTFWSFSVGEEISLELPPQDNGGSKDGHVVWIGPEGIGVKFRIQGRALTEKLVSGQDHRIKGFNITQKEVNNMGKIKNKKLRWEPAAGEEATKYKLYWSENGTVNYSSNFAEVGVVTHVILPDDIPSFPRIAGNLEMGIAAVNQAGNESEITKISAYFDFTVPEAPKSLLVEDV